MPLVLIFLGFLMAATATSEKWAPEALRLPALLLGGALIGVGVLAWLWDRTLEHREEIAATRAREAKAEAKAAAERAQAEKLPVDLNKPLEGS